MLWFKRYSSMNMVNFAIMLCSQRWKCSYINKYINKYTAKYLNSYKTFLIIKKTQKLINYQFYSVTTCPFLISASKKKTEKHVIRLKFDI
jgi:hypothetical protein